MSHSQAKPSSSSSAPPNRWPKPTTEETIEKAPPDMNICLLRGSYPEQAERVERFKTADGFDTSRTVGISPSPPTEEQANIQVAGLSHPKFKETFPYGRMPEYTTSVEKAKQFANGKVLAIVIKRKYLTKGSGTEFGWIARWEAPLEDVMVINWQDMSKPTTTWHPKAD